MKIDFKGKDKRNGNLNEENLNKYITFYLENEIFGIEMTLIQEIIRVPEIFYVPKAHSALIGLANLRGIILPIINLRKVLGIPERKIEELNRIIVINLRGIIGFLVDRVFRIIETEKEEITELSDIQSMAKTEFLKGVIKYENKAIPLLDIEKVFNSEFAKFLERAKEEKKTVTKRIKTYEQEEDTKEIDKVEERQIVSFMVENEEYAIDIGYIKEIVQVPENIVKVPKAEKYIVGITTLRNRVLPLLSLRRIFELEEEPIKENNRVVVIKANALCIGLIVDSVREVSRVSEKFIEPVSPVLFKKRAEIKEICKFDYENRLISIISVSELFKHKNIEEAMKAMKDLETTRDFEELKEVEENEQEEQVVVFILEGEEYAIPIEYVQEIVRVPEELTYIPKAPYFVEGVINLRGNVLPVIDMRKRFDLPEGEKSEQQRIIVLILHKIPIGFIVDAVKEVLKIPEKYIQSAPRFSEEQAKLFGKIANLEKENRLIQIINPEALLTKEEIKEIKEASVEEKESAGS